LTQMMLIGDVHGKWDQYADLLKLHKPERSVQLGDFGVGFHKEDPLRRRRVIDDMSLYGGDNRYIRGNHDNPAVCQADSKYIPDATFEEDTGIFYLGGAFSIDHAYRTQDVDWWHNEELSYNELNAAIDVYERAKPRVVLSHDCPEDIIVYMANWYKKESRSRTRDALSAMWSIHKPDLWVFGHWHKNMTAVFDGCQFTCLNELSWLNINV
jgi:predicted phosphodiesterase